MREEEKIEKEEVGDGVYASTRKRKRDEGAREAGVEPRINPPFSSAFS